MQTVVCSTYIRLHKDIVDCKYNKIRLRSIYENSTDGVNRTNDKTELTSHIEICDDTLKVLKRVFVSWRDNPNIEPFDTIDHFVDIQEILSSIQ